MFVWVVGVSRVLGTCVKFIKCLERWALLGGGAARSDLRSFINTCRAVVA